jgi:hypothetical protein
MKTALLDIFVVEFVVSLVVLMTWESGYGFSSFEEHNTTTRGCRMLRRAPHRKRRRRQRRRCRLEGHLHDG